MVLRAHPVQTGWARSTIDTVVPALISVNALINAMSKNTVAYMLILGAIQSPLQRSMTDHRYQSVCPRCNFENPPWDHLWEGFANEVPADVLLRRYCWPKNADDLALCTAFLKGMKDFA